MSERRRERAGEPARERKRARECESERVRERERARERAREKEESTQTSASGPPSILRGREIKTEPRPSGTSDSFMFSI